MTCPECGSNEWNPGSDDGIRPYCEDCGYIQYSAYELQIQAEVKREQAECKRVLGYVPDYKEAVAKGLAK